MPPYRVTAVSYSRNRSRGHEDRYGTDASQSFVICSTTLCTTKKHIRWPTEIRRFRILYQKVSSRNKSIAIGTNRFSVRVMCMQTGCWAIDDCWFVPSFTLLRVFYRMKVSAIARPCNILIIWAAVYTYQLTRVVWWEKCGLETTECGHSSWMRSFVVRSIACIHVCDMSVMRECFVCPLRRDNPDSFFFSTGNRRWRTGLNFFTWLRRGRHFLNTPWSRQFFSHWKCAGTGVECHCSSYHAPSSADMPTDVNIGDRMPLFVRRLYFNRESQLTGPAIAYTAHSPLAI